jgi:hypothetical protein
MTTKARKRKDKVPDFSLQRGDIPRTIDSILNGLRADEGSIVSVIAIRDANEIVDAVIKAALEGKSRCGSFLGQLHAFLSKRHAELATKNDSFCITFKEFNSARAATRKDSDLRRFIQKTISDVQWAKKYLFYTGQVPPSCIVSVEVLEKLPELSGLENIISEWTDVVVYPALRQRENELRALFDTGKLNKARDENGKFQISRLKPLIRQTVARIANVPHGCYFEIA